MHARLLAIHDALLARFGPQRWWPGDSPFEIMVGAVLTQNTNWANVTRALDNLKQEGLLSFAALEALPTGILAEKIRPSGYYRLKAGRLQGLLAFIRQEYEGEIEAFLQDRLPDVREKLLAVKGIGPETADSILLYAAQKPVFVVDAYTHRILFRHHFIPEEAGYHEIQELFTTALPEDVPLFNEYHALLVRLGKEFCRKASPRCDECPIAGF